MMSVVTLTSLEGSTVLRFYGSIPAGEWLKNKE